MTVEASMFKKAIEGFLKQEFPMYSGRFLVMPETVMYRAKEDEGLWMQLNGRLPNVVEVYLGVNGSQEYVCDISEALKPDQARVVVLNGLLDLKNKMEQRAKRIQK